MSVEALIELRDDLDGMLRHLRSTRNIHAPVFTCRACGATGRGPEPDVSVRATILSLVRFGIATTAQTRRLEKDWTEYRKKNGLDLYGKAPQLELAPSSGCAHPDVW
jgi:hypothetical protein